MPLDPLPALLALSLLSAAQAQSETAGSGFPALSADPFVAGAFEEFSVSPGPSARVLAQSVYGTENGVAFVNLLRWADARAYRGQLFRLRLPVQLTAPSVETSARLWVRVLREDGTAAYRDEGFDTASSSTEWTTLSTTGAIAEDATDLCFGLVVQGPVEVHLRDFELELLGEASAFDLRHAVPERWIQHPDVSRTAVTDSVRGHDLRVTSFTPAGHAAGELPRLFLLRRDRDLGRTYRAGRALLESMRLAQDPPAIVSFVQPGRLGLPGAASEDEAQLAMLELLERTSPDAGFAGSRVVASFAGDAAPRVLLDAGGDGGSRPIEASTGPLEAGLVGGGHLHAERVLLRWTCARHDAGGDAALAALLFEASLETLEPLLTPSAVRQASHSLTGHSCGHDHDHDHSHH